MRYLLIILLLVLPYCATAGDSPYFGEVALGYNITTVMPWSAGQDGGFYGPKDTVRFSLGASIYRGLEIKYSHVSHLSTGWPINDKAEDWLDVVEMSYRFRF